MPRYFLTIEYDGSGFAGWQRQANGRSIQESLEDAGKAISGESIAIEGAGRTDAGVHAIGQTAHADLPCRFTAQQIPLAFNAHLPASIRVISARPVAATAHARFDAIARTYQYRIFTRRAAPALLRRRVWHLPIALDSRAMQDAAQYLCGKHDFTSFRAAACQAKSPIRTLTALTISGAEDEITITAEAPSFLHNQVRIIVGSLVLVGRGTWQPAHIAEVLAVRDRTAAGNTAPPHGLYLVRVDYPASD